MVIMNPLKPLRVLSLFDGISCGYSALKRANIPVEVYYAVELLGGHTRTISNHNHPDIQRPVDDVRLFTKEHAEQIGTIDLLIAGFPCQSFSVMGNKKGVEDPRGLLIHDTMRIINLVKPKVFILENVVPMKKDKNVLDNIIGFHHFEINSKNYGAQCRKRAFWSNKIFFPKIQASPLLVRDILLDDEDERLAECYRLKYKRFDKTNAGKSIGVKLYADGSRRCAGKDGININRTSRVYGIDDKSPVLLVGQSPPMIESKVVGFVGNNGAGSNASRVYNSSSKSPTLLATGGGGSVPPRFETDQYWDSEKLTRN